MSYSISGKPELLETLRYSISGPSLLPSNKEEKEEAHIMSFVLGYHSSHGFIVASDTRSSSRNADGSYSVLSDAEKKLFVRQLQDGDAVFGLTGINRFGKQSFTFESLLANIEPGDFFFTCKTLMDRVSDYLYRGQSCQVVAISSSDCGHIAYLDFTSESKKFEIFSLNIGCAIATGTGYVQRFVAENFSSLEDLSLQDQADTIVCWIRAMMDLDSRCPVLFPKGNTIGGKIDAYILRRGQAKPYLC